MNEKRFLAEDEHGNFANSLDDENSTYIVYLSFNMITLTLPYSELINLRDLLTQVIDKTNNNIVTEYVSKNIQDIQALQDTYPDMHPELVREIIEHKDVLGVETIMQLLDEFESSKCTFDEAMRLLYEAIAIA